MLLKMLVGSPPVVFWRGGVASCGITVIWFLVFNLTKKHLSVKYANWFQHITFSLLYSFEVDLWKGVAWVLLISGLLL